MFKLVPPKTTSELAKEWDALARVRLLQIQSGQDVTYNKVLCPLIVSIIRCYSPTKILDVGCGVGVLTALLAEHADKTIGIDPSANSIDIARENYRVRADFLRSSIEEFSHPLWKFDAIVANMVLMDCANLSEFCTCVRANCESGDIFVWSVTHPFFWAAYYGYANEKWFDYSSEQFVEGPFKISNQTEQLPPSTHIHRPLSMLINAIHRAGFVSIELYEPFPSEDVAKEYASSWDFPRYLVGVSRAV